MQTSVTMVTEENEGIEQANMLEEILRQHSTGHEIRYTCILKMIIMMMTMNVDDDDEC